MIVEQLQQLECICFNLIMIDVVKVDGESQIKMRALHNQTFAVTKSDSGKSAAM